MITTLRNRILCVTGCLSIGCILLSARLPAYEAAPVSTSASLGEYQTVRLTLEQGGVAFDSKRHGRFDVPLFLGLRDGKAVVAWFVHPALSGGRVVWLDASTLKLSETQLRGAFQGRTNRHWGDKNVHYFHYAMDAVVGPDSKATLIDDLSQARPVWKSEAYIPTAYGSAPDNRYPHRAGRSGNGGGAASPVVVDGRVYQFYYQPCGPVGQSRPYIENFIGQPFTDEALLLSKARQLFPPRGNNYQTHKHRGHCPVALVVGGIVYQPGTTGRLYAVDAATGRLLWEYPDAQPEVYVTKQGGIDGHGANPHDFHAFRASQADGALNHHVGAEYQWRPPHTWTTAYANQPIVYPLVDGRLFVRGLDAVYCYDLCQSEATRPHQQ